MKFTETELRELVDDLAVRLGVKPLDIRGSAANQSIVRCRFAVYWYVRRETRASLQEIGRAIGKHHSTLLSGERQFVRGLRDKNTWALELLGRLNAGEDADALPFDPQPAFELNGELLKAATKAGKAIAAQRGQSTLACFDDTLAGDIARFQARRALRKAFPQHSAEALQAAVDDVLTP